MRQVTKNLMHAIERQLKWPAQLLTQWANLLKSRVGHSLFGFFILSYAWAGWIAVKDRPFIDLADTWGFIWRAYKLGWGEGEWVNGFYPVGYPLLLKGIARFTDTFGIAAKYISWSSGVVAALAMYLLLARIQLGFWLALAFSIFFAMVPDIFLWTTTDGTDMAGIAFLLLALVVVGDFSNFNKRRWAGFFLAGAVFGLGYLIRATTLPFLAGLTFFVLVTETPMWRTRAQNISFLLAGFGLVSALQTVPSLLATGNPFYNTQYQNIWFGIYGNWDWAIKWPIALTKTSFTSVVMEDPSKFLAFSLDNLRQIFTTKFLLTTRTCYYLGLFACLAFANYRKRYLGYVFMMVAGAAAISMAFNWERPALPVLPFMIVLGAIGVQWSYRFVSSAMPNLAKIAVTCTMLILLIFMGFRFRKHSLERVTTALKPYDRASVAIGETLSRIGPQEHAHVVSFGTRFQDVNYPWTLGYKTGWFAAQPTFTDLPGLAAYVKQQDARYFILGLESESAVPALKTLLANHDLKSMFVLKFDSYDGQLWALPPDSSQTK